MLEEMISYQNFAYYYNKLIPHDFYQDYANKINDYGNFNNILDLACGSGTLCFILKNDYNYVSGLDLSQEMLMIAQDYNQENKKGVQFINQDLNFLNITKNSYDLITCTLDSLNYIEQEKSIMEIIKSVSNSLMDNGLFCFDILTDFYVDNVVNDYYQCEELDDFEYVWKVKKVDNKIIKHDLTILSDDNSYHEEHLQFIYDESLIENYLNKYDLIIKDKEYEYNELNDEKPSRVYYVCQRRERK
ncbi:SAM-dependent methyltransferase [Bacilli bacterium PM5-3]|nr:SAM-dependent methyltransferase [Bacilli bacterium PM5-3]